MFRDFRRWTSAPLLVVALGLPGCFGPSADASLNKAKALLAKGQTTDALIELKTALQAKPDLGEARLLMGQVLLDQSDPAGAIIELQRARDLGLAPAKVVPLLARAHFAAGDAQKTIAIARDAALQDPAAAADLGTTLSLAYASQGLLSDARAAVDAALTADAGNSRARLQKARLVLVGGNLEAAEGLIDAVLGREPGNSEALLAKADLALARQDDAGATTLLRQAIAASRSNTRAHSLLIERLLRAGDLPAAQKAVEEMRAAVPKRLETVYYEGRLALARGEARLAQEKAQRLLSAAPEHPPFLEFAGYAATLANEIPAAEKHFSKLLGKDPQSARARRQLATTQLRLGDADLALSTLAPLLSAGSPDAEAMTLAGRAYFLKQNYREAATLLSQAHKVRPDDAGTRLAMGAARIRLGEPGGLGDLEAAAAADSKTDADLALIATLVSRGDAEGALKAIARLESKPAGQAVAPVLRAQVQMGSGDIGAARASLTEATARDPTSFQPVRLLTELDVRDGRPDDGIARVRAFLKQRPKDVQALLLMTLLQGQFGRAEDIPGLVKQAIDAAPGDVRPRLALVRWHEVRGEWPETLAAALAAVNVAPGSYDAQAALGRAHAASGEANQAMTVYSKLAAAYPRRAEPLLGLADAQRAGDRPDQAVQSALKAAALEPDVAAVLMRAAQIVVAAGREEDALAFGRRVQSQAPKSPVGHVIEGDAEAARKRWPAAAIAYRAALARESDPAFALRLHAAYLSAGDRVQASSFAAEWLKRQPRDLGFLFHLADRAVADRKADLAEQYLRRALAVSPDSPQALNRLAWLLAEAKRAEALGLAEKAVALRPNQPSYLDTLAMILGQSGQAPRALELQKRAVDLAPAEHEFRLRLARMYLAAGARDKARAELNVLSKLGDRFGQQDEVKALLARL